MKLSTPRTIQTNINEQRRLDIDNGLKLAQKVDVLREKVLEEEKRLELHKTVTIGAVQKEIDEKIQERDYLRKEISILSLKREALLVPLDAEWSKLNAEKETIEVTKNTFEQKQTHLDEEIAKLTARKQVLSKEEKKLQNNIDLSKLELDDSHKTLLDAQKCLTDARDEEKRIKGLLDARERKVKEQKDVVQATLLSISIREKAVKNEEQFIVEEKIRLKDMRETLERAIARTKQ